MATKKKSTSKKKSEPVEEVLLASRENYEKALAGFEAAYADLGQRNFGAALEGFRKVLEEFPDEIDIGDRVRVYLRLCERELAEAAEQPTDSESVYLRAVFEMNEGRFDRAMGLYDEVLTLRPGHDAAIYGSAVALAQVGRKADAMKRLREAVDANPQNRILALNDPDFECVRDEPEFIDLVEPEESRGGESPAA